MVARQRERSAGGGRGGRCAWERRPQGVEPLGVILSLSPCPPRRFFRHAWGCAPPRRGRGRGELLPPSPPPGADPHHTYPYPQPPLPLVSTADRRPGSGRQYRARGSPPSRREEGGRPTPPHTPQPCCWASWGPGRWPPALGAPGASCGGGAPLPPPPLPCSIQWLFPTFLRGYC